MLFKMLSHRNDVQVLQLERRAQDARHASAVETAARATPKEQHDCTTNVCVFTWCHAACYFARTLSE